MTHPIGGVVAQRLADLGISLPSLSVPQGSYVPYVLAGDLLYVAGQGPRLDGVLKYSGKVDDASIEDGKAAARLCGLNIIAQVAHACDGDLDRVKRVVRLAGFVNCGSDFTKHAGVLNGASDVMHDVFAEHGLHTRIVSGAGSLPSDMSVIIEAVFQL